MVRYYLFLEWFKTHLGYILSLPGTASPTTTTKGVSSITSITSTTTATAPGSTSSICPGSLTKFTYFGVSEASAEFGASIPGVLGTDYTWPVPSSIDVGFSVRFFRLY
jgi:endoglucanase